MTNLVCNNCQTTQKARICETLVPSDLPHSSELSRFFLLIIDKCKKCFQKKIFSVGLTYLGSYIEFDFLKTKQFKVVENRIIQEVATLPSIKKKSNKDGFYLLYLEYGQMKPCYSNLSSLKLGLDKNWDINCA